MGDTFRSETEVDKKIREEFFPDYTYKGIMVEVGAATPELISNSYHFRMNGWRTICIEPNPTFVELHKAVGSEVYEYACSNKNEDDIEFIKVGTLSDANKLSYHSFSHLKDDGFLYLSKEFQDAYDSCKKETILVKVRTLNFILNSLNVNKIDILSIDVEGREDKVLEGIDLKKYQPKIIILENLGTSFRKEAPQYGYTFYDVLKYDEIYVYDPS